MGIANFFEKSAKAASHVVKNFDSTAFTERLNAQRVCLSYDSSACRSPEARASLELATDLLARLFPWIAFRGHGSGCEAVTQRLVAHARSVNPEIEIGGIDDEPTLVISFGRNRPTSGAPIIFAGSDGWVARLSGATPVGSGSTSNPFGAGAAACIAVANVFRHVFADALTNGEPDKEVSLSVFDFASSKRGSGPDLKNLTIGEVHLIGLGAIGSACAWALSNLKLSGDLHLIDHENVELSNLQRYALTTQSDIGESKVRRCGRLLGSCGLRVHEHQATWSEYIEKRGDYRLELVGVALDNIPDRLLVQGGLPRRVVNAWTQRGDLGVSRHGFGGEDACLACLYRPVGKSLDFDEVVARSVGLLHVKKEVVRHLLFTNQPVGRQVLEMIAEAKKVPLETLLPFETQPLRVFYQNAVCGSMLLPSSPEDEQGRGAEVPMAFQSALAGILLASELLIEGASLRAEPFPVATRLNLLAPLGTHLNQHEKKRGGCICLDPDFLAVYRAKYPIAPPHPRQSMAPGQVKQRPRTKKRLPKGRRV